MTLLVLLLFVGAAAAIYKIAFSDTPLPWGPPSERTQTEAVEEAPEPEPIMRERPYEDPLPVDADADASASEETIADYIEEDLLTTEDETDPAVVPKEDSLEIAAPSSEELGITDVPEEPVEGGVED
jgi:hypothetical protein